MMVWLGLTRPGGICRLRDKRGNQTVRSPAQMKAAFRAELRINDDLTWIVGELKKRRAMMGGCFRIPSPQPEPARPGRAFAAASETCSGYIDFDRVRKSPPTGGSYGTSWTCCQRREIVRTYLRRDSKHPTCRCRGGGEAASLPRYGVCGRMHQPCYGCRMVAMENSSSGQMPGPGPYPRIGISRCPLGYINTHAGQRLAGQHRCRHQMRYSPEIQRAAAQLWNDDHKYNNQGSSFTIYGTVRAITTHERGMPDINVESTTWHV